MYACISTHTYIIYIYYICVCAYSVDFHSLGFQGRGVEASDHSTVDPSSQDAEHRPDEQFNGSMPIAGWFILKKPVG